MGRITEITGVDVVIQTNELEINWSGETEEAKMCWGSIFVWKNQQGEMVCDSESLDRDTLKKVLNKMGSMVKLVSDY
jgi:hypothetical protein